MLEKRKREKGIRKQWLKMSAAAAGLLLSGFVLLSSGSTEKVTAESTQEQLSNAKSLKASTQEQIDAAQSQINALSGEVGTLSGELSELSNMNEAQRRMYSQIASDMQMALQEQQKALDMYLKSLENLNQQQLEYSERMGTMIEYKGKSTIEVFLSSDSLSGFFTQMEMIELIGEADQQAMDRLEAAIDDAELKRSYAEDQVAVMQVFVDEKQAELDALRNQMDITQVALNEKRAVLSEWEQKENDLLVKSQNLEQQIKNLQAQAEEERAAAAAAAAQMRSSSGGGNTVATGSMGGSSGSGSNAGGFTWPYPGYSSGSSRYGMRIHPISGVRKMHTGEDIGGSYGDTIVAAKDGKVIIASAPVSGQNTGGSGYGNYLVIDHGDGVSTLYGHCRTLYVGLGESVVAGQSIAEVGSTGTSTGPHLHFEIRINGSHVDPNNYY